MSLFLDCAATDTKKFIGSMCFMSGSIEMENVYVPENEVGVWQWLFGKSVSSIVFHNPGPSDGFVGIAAPFLARILPVLVSTLSNFCGYFLYCSFSWLMIHTCCWR